ncbi:hypothetical protein GCM10023310_21440 [Paenibacillus vulneris]
MLLDSHLDEMLHFSKAYFADWDYGRSDVKLYGLGKTREHPETQPMETFHAGVHGRGDTYRIIPD